MLFQKQASEKKVLLKQSRDERLTELLKQNQYSPMTIAEQVVSIFTGVNGYLDDLELNQISDFEKDLFELIKSSHSEIIQSVNPIHFL